MRCAFRASRAIRKSANPSDAGRSLADRWKNLSYRRHERGERQTILPVVVLPILKVDRGSDQDGPVNRSGEVQAKAVAEGVRHGIDEAVDQVASGHRKLGVLTPARVDAKRLSSRKRRDLIRIEASRIDHQLRF
jgi:hypothetical protein